MTDSVEERVEDEGAAREADPEQAALESLAAEVEAGTASADELSSLAEEVDEKPWWEQFLDDLQTKGLLGAVISIFVKDSSQESAQDSSPEVEHSDPDISIINTNPYPVTSEELETFNSNEQRSLRIIAQAGISPRNANELYEQISSSSINREKFLGYLATSVEACSHFQVAPDRMLPLIMATMKMESNFSERAYNSSSGATGLMQHMPQYWQSRAHDLVLSGAFSTSPDIWDTRAQIFASVQYYLNDLRRITDDPSTYPANKFGRDAYLTYNSGGGHAWLARIGAMDWPPERVRELYNMPVEQRVAQYGSAARTFKDYALERITRPIGERSFDRVQQNYERYRNVLYRDSALNA